MPSLLPTADAMRSPSDSETRPCDATAAATRRRRRLTIAIASVLAVAALITWHKALKYRFVAKRWGVVEPGLIYRSGQISRWMIEKTLARHGIGVVVDLTSLDPANESQQAELAAVEKLGIRHVRLPLRGDGTGDVGCYAAAIDILSQCQQSGTPVLVHCAAGAFFHDFRRGRRGDVGTPPTRGSRPRGPSL